MAAPGLVASSSLASEVLLTGSRPVSSPASSVVELLSRMFSFDPLLDLEIKKIFKYFLRNIFKSF